MENNKIDTKLSPKTQELKAKHKKGIESLKGRYGRLFVLHWEIGIVLFFIIPIIKSIHYSFGKVETLIGGGTEVKWVGLTNYNYIWNKDPQFTKNLTETIGSFAYSLPVILVLSLILALLLNQKFRGRLFFRSLYFLPVIIASGVVIDLLFKSTQSELSSSGVSDSFAANMISVDEILSWVNLPPQIGMYFEQVISNIFELLWSCGIQIVLFISGMQSIPDSYYEVSKVEGASKWEEFWFITLPLLGRTILLVLVFTFVELITSKSNSVMTQAYTFMNSSISQYGTSSALLWSYFAIATALMGIILLVYTKTCLKRWDTSR